MSKKNIFCCLAGVLFCFTAANASFTPSCENLKSRLENKIDAVCSAGKTGTLNCTVKNNLEDKQKTKLEKVGCKVTDKAISCSCNA